MYLHVDINAYFATLLQQETPALRGKPLGIVKEVGRSCIIAASKEAKLQGVKTGSSLADALVCCPNLVLIPANFDLYLAATIKLKKLFSTISPDVEVFSLDESFIPFASVKNIYQSPQALGHLLQDQIKIVLGEWVTCNVGIASTRFLAKMTGETAPKGSVVTTEESGAPALLAVTTFADVCGIGSRLAKRLEQFGVTVPYQINFLPELTLKRWFGPFWSVELKKMAQGQEPLFLDRLTAANQQAKSVGRSITLFQLAADEQTIKRTLYNLCTEVMYKVRTQKLVGRSLGVSLSGQNQVWHRQITLRHSISHTAEFFNEIFGLYQSWQRTFPVIRFAVYLSLLQSTAPAQQSLLPDWWNAERVESALDSINNKYGLYTIRSGLLATDPVIRPEVTGFLGDKSYQLETWPQ